MRVRGNIHLLRGVLASNVFLLDGGRGSRFLVDTGHFAELPALLLELRRRGIGPRDLTGVLLTHRHSDHAGNARFFAKNGVAIYAHRADAETLARKTSPPRLPAEGGTMLARTLARFENILPAPRVEVDRALEDGDELCGLEVHHVPGHTEGSVFYRHVETGALLTGDTLLTAVPMITPRGMSLPYPTFTADLGEALGSLYRFHMKGMKYDSLLAGHGTPILSGAQEKVEAFLLQRGVLPRPSGKLIPS